MNKLSVDFEERKAKTVRFYEDFKEEHSLIPIIINELFQNEVWINKKIKIVFDRLFKEEARHMVASFKKYKDKAPLIFDHYVF